MRQRSSGGCGSFLGLLFAAFLLLKLTGAVDWSWWWVTSPLWLPAALFLGGMALLAATGVSVYKFITSALRRQGAGAGAGAGTGAGRKSDVVDAEGSEVAVKPDGGQQPLSLPPAANTSDPEVEDPSA